MDTVETMEGRLLEALTRAMLAEKVADKALAAAMDAVAKVEVLRQLQAAGSVMPALDNLSTSPDQPDPFSDPDELAPPVRLSPFTLRATMAQTVKQASEQVEKGLSDSSISGETE